MVKGNRKSTKTERKEEVERKRDERCRRNALKKERKIKEYLEHDENFVSFSNQLQAQGLKIKDILGDGNCLFRALGDQLEGDHTTHGRHRRETVRYMKEHREDFEPFVEDNMAFDKHLKELSQLGTYGGNDSIVAFARNNGINVTIHQLNEPRWVISGSQYSRTGRILELHLSYHNGDHYSSVRNVNDPDDSPAWPYHSQQTAETQKLQSSNEMKTKKGKTRQKSKVGGTSAGNMPNARGACGHVASYNGCGDSLEIEQTVMAATGCKDLAVVAQSLEENGYNVDAAINYVLQLMCIAEEQGCTGDHCLGFGSATDAFDDDTVKSGTASSESLLHHQNDLSPDASNTERTSSTENCCDHATQNSISIKSETDNSSQLGESSETQESLHQFVENLRDSLADPEHSQPKLPEQGARPKVTRPKSGQRQTKLSNKKRKELAKQEKKKRRMEERKENRNQSSVTQQVAPSGNVNGGQLVADLGTLAI